MNDMNYISALMSYIQEEYDNVPEFVTPEMEDYFRECEADMVCLPNAAGVFYETFLRSRV
jgi:hypothetical protein